jgi:hypothetical protein
VSDSRVTALVLGLLIGVCASFADLVVGGFNCQTDTAYCAEGGSDVTWEGRLFDPGGRRGSNVVVSLDFGSVFGGPEVRTRTDGRGRFCVRWPNERLVARVEVDTFAGRGPRDPRLASPSSLRFDASKPDPQLTLQPPPGARVVLLTNNPLLDGGAGVFVNADHWKPDIDSLRRCQDTDGPPWYRRDDAFGNWRSVGAIAIGLLTVLVGAVGLVLRRRPVGAGLAIITVCLGLASGVAFLVVWGPVL